MTSDKNHRKGRIFGMAKRKAGIRSSDPMGSYTGVGENPLEKPVQDADDL